jgi:hypothetical protein
MLSVVDDARTAAGDGHAAGSVSFNEMFMQVVGVFSNARARRHGRACVLGLLSHAEAKGEAGLDHYQVRKYRAWSGIMFRASRAMRELINAWDWLTVFRLPSSMALNSTSHPSVTSAI